MSRNIISSRLEGGECRKYKFTLAKSFFWRTTQQQEIDYVEEIGTTLTAFEFKWNPKRKATISKTFTKQYDAEGVVISRHNFREFVMV
jgi:hypothetical protein